MNISTININDISNINYLSSERNINILKETLSILNKYKKNYYKDFSILSEDINLCINEITKIYGKNFNNEEILDEIFSKFCIGK
ncbi:hypothetical protein [Candidatus Nardonella dryophthoridicola]|uniref:hypothetical protein n=1 Tax=Candidatus Nardonella dryophthoridicola TaxID=1971485 RepID=UPI003B96E090